MPEAITLPMMGTHTGIFLVAVLFLILLWLVRG